MTLLHLMNNLNSDNQKTWRNVLKAVKVIVTPLTTNIFKSKVFKVLFCEILMPPCFMSKHLRCHDHFDHSDRFLCRIRGQSGRCSDHFDHSSCRQKCQSGRSSRDNANALTWSKRASTARKATLTISYSRNICLFDAVTTTLTTLMTFLRVLVMLSFGINAGSNIKSNDSQRTCNIAIARKS